MQETRLHRTETGSQEGCQEFCEQSKCVWELDNWQWKAWMPVRLLQSLSVAERGFFQDLLSLGIRTSEEDNLCNEMSQDGVIKCHCSSTLRMMSYITFLQMLHHNFCNCLEWKQNRPFTRPIFSCVAKNGLGRRLGERVCCVCLPQCSRPVCKRVHNRCNKNTVFCNSWLQL